MINTLYKEASIIALDIITTCVDTKEIDGSLLLADVYPIDKIRNMHRMYRAIIRELSKHAQEYFFVSSEGNTINVEMLLNGIKATYVSWIEYRLNERSTVTQVRESIQYSQVYETISRYLDEFIISTGTTIAKS